MSETNETFQFDELTQATSYPLSVLRAFAPGIGDDILEVGSGIGNFTRFLRKQYPERKLTLLEPNPDFCGQLQDAYPGLPLHKGVTADMPEDFHCDTIININVLEHIEDDEEELRHYARILSPSRGHLCLFLPARPEIHAPIDDMFGHFRRYTRNSLRQKLNNAGFEIEKLRYSNLIGYFGWAVEFKWRKNKHFTPWKVSLFDKIAWPVLSRIEAVIPPPIGQSLLAIARVRE